VTSGSRCEQHAFKRESNWSRFRQERPSSAKRGYGRTWQKERRGFLLTHPRCAGCGAKATLVDHIVPHRGNPALFWDRTNWQPLCFDCHARKSARHQ